jgi:hypothetical protein
LSRYSRASTTPRATLSWPRRRFFETALDRRERHVVIRDTVDERAVVLLHFHRDVYHTLVFPLPTHPLLGY